MHERQVEEAWKYLRLFQKWWLTGEAGRLLMLCENEEAKKWKEERRTGECFSEWCVRKTLQVLGEPLSNLICENCGFHNWDVDKVQTSQEQQPDGNVTPTAYLICPICGMTVEL